MSDVDGAAPAAAEGTAVEVVETPNPIVTEAEPAKVEAANKAAAEKAEAEKKDKPEPEKKAPTNREALIAAAKKVAAKDTAEPVKDAKVEAKPDAKAAEKPAAKVEAKVEPVKDGPVKDPTTGKFVSPNPEKAAEKVASESKYPDAPTRFTNDAKAAWKDAPENVRAEVHRAVGELERGFEKHREKAAAYDKIAPFDELAKKTGTTIDAAMSRYVQMDQLLQRDFMGGLEKLCANRGVSLRDVAAQIMGQKPDQVAGKQDRTISELRQTVERLQQQIGGVTKTIEQQRSESVMSKVEAFAAEPGHERFDELSPDIELFLKSGKTNDITEAYRMAERLNPAPAASEQQVEKLPAPDLTAQTLKGGKSIAGAPGPGSNPNTRAPSPSNKEALRRAFARVG